MGTKQTPQARWAKRMVESGRCRICGQPRSVHKWLCAAHAEAFKLYMRAWRARRKAATPTVSPAA